MVSETEFKQALKVIDRNTRLCLLYISEHIDQKLEVYSTLQTSHRTLIDTKVSQLEKQLGTWQGAMKSLEILEVKLQGLIIELDKLEPQIRTAKELMQEFDNIDTKEEYIRNQVSQIFNKAVLPVLDTKFEQAKKDNDETVKILTKFMERLAPKDRVYFAEELRKELDKHSP